MSIQYCRAIYFSIYLTSVACQANFTKTEFASNTRPLSVENKDEEITLADSNVTLADSNVTLAEINVTLAVFDMLTTVPDNETSENFREIDNSNGEDKMSNEKNFHPVDVMEPVFEEWEEIPLYFFETVYQTHIWDKTLYTPEQYQLSFCGKMCIGEETVYVKPFSCPTIRCFDCICDRPRCEIYGICCPTDPAGFVFPDFFKVKKTATDNSASMQDIQVSDDTRNSPTPARKPEPNFEISYARASTVKCQVESWGRYLYIQSCPLGYEDSVTRKLCEANSLPGEDITLDMFARVSDNTTGIIYRNIFCAFCNDLTEVRGPIFLNDHNTGFYQVLPQKCALTLEYTLVSALS
ncbi:hypothetical protein ElyMa_006249200 [Elysia marginata]|uniref:SMB domain-containing protein n=1 Tax=Elysia marginata TaxID=1093978 RepID=A0AAV4HAC8_9GAST|nr:hypothetical protein ElyMa_006249200 [Elysia marginata]